MEFLKLIESYEEDIIKSTQELIKIKSVEEDPLPGKPFGEGPYKALENILDLGKSMGFKTKNLEGYAGYIEFGEGKETVGILGHIDVVPEGTGWTYPPYEAKIFDGKIYGRGAIDDKGPTIAALYAMKALKDSGAKINKKIRMIIGANEETDWRCMDYYFNHEEAPDMAFTPDADFPVIHAEKGIMVLELSSKVDTQSDDVELISLKAGSASNVVPEKAIAIIDSMDNNKLKDKLNKFLRQNNYNTIIKEDDSGLRIISSGTTAHGSTPEKGESAIHNLMRVLGEVFTGNGDVSKFVKIYNERIAFYHHGEKIGCKLEDDVVGKLSFNPGVLELVNNEISIDVDIRYPVKNTYEDVYNGIKNNLKDTNIKVKIIDKELVPLFVEKNDPLVEKLMNVYIQETGDENAEPVTIGGGTYARAMDNAVAFGPMLPGMESLAHQKNEYIDINHLIKLSRIYTKALYELAK